MADHGPAPSVGRARAGGQPVDLGVDGFLGDDVGRPQVKLIFLLRNPVDRAWSDRVRQLPFHLPLLPVRRGPAHGC